MMFTIYQTHYSGNCYKVRLLAAQLGIALQLIEVDSNSGQTRRPEFLAKNPNGKVPVLEYAPGEFLPESNAILWYLAHGTAFYPTTQLAQAQTLQWLSFEQYSHEPYIAVLRNWLTYAGVPAGKEGEIKERHAKGVAALTVMEKHLKDHPFFVGEQYGIADIALYAYTHMANEGGFKLEDFPSILGWCSRVRSHPQHVPIR